MSENRPKRFHISGRVIDARTRLGVEGLRVEGWDKDLLLDDFLGSAQTDEQGSFRFDFDESRFAGLVFDRAPELFLKVLLDELLLAATDPVTLAEGGGVTAGITVEVAAPERSPRPAERTTPPAGFNGTLVNAANGYPLAGLYVRAYFVEPDSRADGHVLLGEGATDASGRFRVRPLDDERVRERLLLLRQGEGEGSLRLEAGVPGRDPFYTSEVDGAFEDLPLPLRVQLPEVEVTAEHWKQLGERMEEARLLQLHSLVAELTTVPPERSLFGDWSPELRQSVVTELERTFLDPDRVLRSSGVQLTMREQRRPEARRQLDFVVGEAPGDEHLRRAVEGLELKVEGFDNLYAVDWVLDASGFKDGDPGRVIQAADDVYGRKVTDGGDWLVLGGGLNRVPIDIAETTEEAPADLIPYRNYLRNIFTGPKGSPQYNTLMGKLRDRLHQDFETESLTRKPANKILADILTEILSAPSGDGYGFERDPGMIPLQGTTSDREYLDFLITLAKSPSKVPARELSLRYRLDFERPDTARSSEVEENIAALQGFYRDTPESAPDPFPIFDSQKAGLAPFFLYLDEWRQQTKPFFAENFYQITSTVSGGALYHEEMVKLYQNSARGIERWGVMLILVEDKLGEANRKLALGQYASADQLYDDCLKLAREALYFYHSKRSEFGWTNDSTHAKPAELDDDASYRADMLGALPMNGPADLAHFVHLTVGDAFDTHGPKDVFQSAPSYYYWLTAAEARLRLMLIHLIAHVLPVCRGDVALASGDYARASTHYAAVTRFIVGRADAEDFAGYFEQFYSPPSLFLDGPLPYTVDLSADRETKNVGGAGFDTLRQLRYDDKLAGDLALAMLHPMEKKFFRLRHGNALLEWADALYRTGEASSVARARELYKAVMILHGEPPPISPTWTSTAPTTKYDPHSENPAVESQKTRAWRGFEQIELGLNYYGLNDAHVPWLRYRTLKDAADRFAAAAKSAQQDFLSYMGKLEEGLREGIVNANLLKKARLQAQVADEQRGIAEYNVAAAKQQVAQVQAAIEAKRNEIKKHEELLTQVSDWVDGFKSALTGVGGEGVLKDFAKDGGGGGAAASGLGAAGAPLAAYAVFLYAGITSASKMADAQDARGAELRTLEDTALPWAEEGVRAREHEVAIANLQKAVAVADAELAVALMKFQESRTLNVEFWGQVSLVVKRLMRRYLELGARFAWLAERALAYEQDRTLGIIRFDYFPPKLQGVTGADLLQLDLAELEAARLDQMRTLVPVRHTYSLAFDFPLQFAELKQTGRCRFQTTELPFRLAYPGTYGYRIIAMSVAVKAASGALPARGLLRNEGVSLVSRVGGDTHYSVRFPDAFPLSEFRLREDMFVYSLPGEALMSFEGSGVETFWELVFPTHANPYGLQNVADIQLTFDARASYSPTLYAEHTSHTPRDVERLLLFSAQALSPAGLAALHDASQGSPHEVELTFDLTQAPLPQGETDRRVGGLFIAFAGEGELGVKLKFGPKGGAEAEMLLRQGTAFSNDGAWKDAHSILPPHPLNQFLNTAIESVWQLKIDKGLSPQVDFSKIVDVVLGIEYEARTA